MSRRGAAGHSKLRRALGVACGLGLGLGVGTNAATAAPCEGLNDAVLVTGSSALRPLLSEIGRLLEVQGASSGGGLRLFYDGPGSCGGVVAVLDPQGYAPEALTYWDGSGEEIQCEVEAGAALPPVIGVSDVFAGTCVALPNGLPSNLADFQGPVQAMVFAAPAASRERIISAEAAYYVFGFGEASGVSPWTDPSMLLHRDIQSGTQAMMASAIGVPADRFRGTSTESTGDLLRRLQSVPSVVADGALGILSAHAAESNRASLATLAFQDFGQACGVLPNRSATSNEKRHVRDGSYPIWGPVHLLTNVNEERRPVSAAVDSVVSFLLGTANPLPSLDLIQLEAEQHLVPQCAMRVMRTHEMAPPREYLPEQPCGCYYELVSNGETSCAECSSGGQCGSAEICSHGYCEPIAPPTSSSSEP